MSDLLVLWSRVRIVAFYLRNCHRLRVVIARQVVGGAVQDGSCISEVHTEYPLSCIDLHSSGDISMFRLLNER
jgi:hypothetical protein